MSTLTVGNKHLCANREKAQQNLVDKHGTPV